MQTAIQLWTLRTLREPLSAVLDRVAAAGYDAVEFAGVGDPGASRRALDDAGLGVVGAHVGIDALQSEQSAVARQLDALEVPFVVVPYLDVDHFADADAVAATATMLDTLDATYDRPLLYHNHDHEFAALDGETAYDRLIDETSVGFELDAGWARAAGRDPVDLLDRLDGRAPVVHLKDVTAEGEPTALGDGVLELEAVVAAAREAGTEWLVFEHDEPDDPEAAITNGIDGLRALLS
ncbi:sugar phosphate isomerase/epimerase family protein [Haloarcula salina]|uniref:Sugar phosphate isomerase/epimerase n=1 Tax=Haloarcula salina TaxID=1429914 RepID=A0AA41KKA1_9EURY|nr:sugar phosphate isomerase/epimerase [Haloarcula salina]MBV0901674.1 sugar phosphate isomerase/epimerase [Haloarcula salina]